MCKHIIVTHLIGVVCCAAGCYRANQSSEAPQGAPGVETYCTPTSCPGGQVCLRGGCSPDPCAALVDGQLTTPKGKQFQCGSPDLCVADCVATADLCAGIKCAGDETCFEGECVPGCFGTGGAVPYDLDYDCNALCPVGFVCQLRCEPPDLCVGVKCNDCEACVAGKCFADPCSCVSCAPGQMCKGGACIDTCLCPPPGCAPGVACIEGQCCIPDCNERPQVCGKSDGCGGICDCPELDGGTGKGGIGPADGGGTSCTPMCPPGKPCVPNGCGGMCNTCPSGQSCFNGGCCTPNCAPGTCGVNNGCGGTCQCNGNNQVCTGGKCCTPQCGPGSCGQPDGCGGKCSTCPTGLTCEAGVCVVRDCSPPCGCGQRCLGGACVARCSGGLTPCGCTNCCAPGTCNPSTGTCAPPVK